jgi:regulator of sigma E protease
MLVSILIFLLVLSVLVLVHEFGHFIVARKSGILVEEFGFGLPPRLFGKKIGETIYSINALPFGGFVRLHGEQDEQGITKPGRAFLNKSNKTRFLVIIAGVIMNFILAIIAFAVVSSFSGIPRDTGKLKIIDVASGSPAQTAGLVAGDIITQINGSPVTSTEDFISKTDAVKGKKAVLEIQKNAGGEQSISKVTLIPRESPPQGEGPIGVTITTTEIYYPPVWQRPFYGVYYGFRDALFWGQTIVVGLGGLFGGLFKGQVPQDISGPVGIFAVTAEAAKFGVLTLVNFVGILSVNLAILNILPFPALDGGRLLFIGIEAVTRKKVSVKTEAMIHNVGMLILLTLLLVITIGDVHRLITFGGVQGFINSIGNSVK